MEPTWHGKRMRRPYYYLKKGLKEGELEREKEVKEKLGWLLNEE